MAAMAAQRNVKAKMAACESVNGVAARWRGGSQPKALNICQRRNIWRLETKRK
jgi:hypothetical protein